MSNYILPKDGENSVNLVNSILKSYGVTPFHTTMKDVDEILEKKYKHVFLLLLDGFGSNVLKTNLSKNSFISTHKLRDYQPVFPSTTVAATDAIQAGKYPIEIGWIGWHQYFKDIDKDVVVFQNLINNSDEVAADFNVAERYIPYEKVTDLIHKHNENVVTGDILPSYAVNGCLSFEEQVDRMIEVSQSDNRTFYYVYWTQPDGAMHGKGTHDPEVKEICRNLDKQLERLYKEMGEDTIVFFTPDHGMKDVKELTYHDKKDFVDCLIREPSLESRCNAFYVKEEKKEEFVKLFDKYFGKHFLLFTAEEIIEKEIMGNGPLHPLTRSFLGDYVGISIDEYYLRQSPPEDEFVFKGHHAGLTAEEIIIPLVVIKKDLE